MRLACHAIAAYAACMAVIWCGVCYIATHTLANTDEGSLLHVNESYYIISIQHMHTGTYTLTHTLHEPTQDEERSGMCGGKQKCVYVSM